MKKTISLWRAIAAIGLACAYVAVTMYEHSKFLLIKQAASNDTDVL